MDIVEEIKSRLNIEDVVGEYIVLKRAGRNWRGLSPFTHEKSPSFIVSPEKQIWHDFSSGKGGDIFSFIMEMEGIDFKGSLEVLARKAGLEEKLLNTRNITRKSSINKERLYEILELATKFYQVQFKNNQMALNYVFKIRKYTKETALLWRFGYSPINGNELSQFLLKKGYQLQEVKQTGLVMAGYKGDNDMFHHRLMIPLQDDKGRVIGFTARILDDSPKLPKYINTPQTILYDKSRHVFGLHFAKNAIRKHGFAVLVEGNLDVISSHQGGILNVVATAGTALTTYHLKTLARFTTDIRLSFDADQAGINASERAIAIASNAGVNLSIVNLISGKDPDELIKNDKEKWLQSINNNIYVVDWLINRYQKIYDLNSAEGKKKFTDVLLPVIKNLKDEVEKEHYLVKISEIIQIDRQALDKKSANYSNVNPILKKIKKNNEVINRDVQELSKIEDNFLCLMLMRPTLRDLMQSMKQAMFYKKESINLFKFLRKNLSFALNNLTTDASLFSQIDISQNYVKIELLLYEELYSKIDLNDLFYEASFLRLRLVEYYVKIEKEKIKKEFSSASEDEVVNILSRVNKLNALLNRFKGANING